MRVLLIALVLVLGLGGYWAWTQVRPLAEVFLGVGHVRHEWNQKLTLTVATPDGPKTGAAVVTVAAIFGKQLSGNEVVYGHKGEATVVEVAPGTYLFALLGGTDERFFRAARDRFKGKERGEWLYDIPKQTEPVELTGDAVPLLVTFTDITDPTTVTRVDPTNLAASFGPGVSLTSVTLAVTEEPVTEGRVEAVLPWLEAVGRDRASLKGKPESGLVSNQPDPQIYMIAPSDFSTELYR